MRSPAKLALVAVTILLLCTASLTAGAHPAAEAAPIEQALLDRLAAEGTASFFVQMAVQADLSVADSIADWHERGDTVYAALREVAAASQGPVLAYARGRGLEAHTLIGNNSVYVRDGDRAAALALADLPGVSMLRLERTWELPDTRPALAAPEAEVSWGLLDTHAPELWAVGIRGSGARVAGIDTGVQWDHPALMDSYGCPDDPGNEACWYDPSNVCGGEPCDNNGHGSHTMGTMVANDDPSFPHIAGMAPDATWIACKGCESASCSEFALTSCGDWVVAPGGDPDNRPHVANNAWGGGGCDDWFRPWVLAWQAAGILPAFSAGGSGPGCNSLGSPGDYMESFASTGHNVDRTVASFAGRGPSCFGEATKPNASAPAVNICSTVPTDGWSCYSGTSMATSHTGGAVALIVSACPQLAYDVPGLFDLIHGTADEPPDGNCGAPPGGDGNHTYGHGYVNPLAAIETCAAGTMHVHRIAMAYRDLGDSRVAVLAVLRILDDAGAAVDAATVEGEWTVPGGMVRPQVQVTNWAGKARFQVRTPLVGEYELCVTDVIKAGYVYDPDQNHETCDTVSVP